MKPTTGTGSALITLKDIEISLGNVVLKQRGSAEAIAHYYWEDDEPASYVEPPMASLFTLTKVLLCERISFANAYAGFPYTEMSMSPATDVLQYMSDEQCEEMTRFVEEGLREEAFEYA